MPVVLHIEGVNFDACLYDTDNLSVVRGASLLMETLGRKITEVVGAKPIVDGGSLAVFELSGLKSKDAKEAKDVQKVAQNALKSGDYAHLSFVCALGDGDCLGKAMVDAQNRGRIAQLQDFTYRPSDIGHAERQDALDQKRSATVTQEMKGGEEKLVSSATQRRFQYGKDNRFDFYEKELGEKDHDWEALKDNACYSLQDLVESPPEADDIPETIKNKAAVVHLDGDNFGKVEDKQKLSEAMKTKKTQILWAVVEDALSREPKENGRLRLEVLIWGGDDITFVMPAWRVFGFLKAFFKEIEDWEVNGQSLGFTAGVVIANKKSPIRLLTKLAGMSVDLAKGMAKEKGRRGSVSFDIFESVAPMEAEELAEYRKARLSGGDTNENFAFDVQKISTITDEIKKMKTEAEAEEGMGESEQISRSELYKILAKETDKQAEAELEKYLERVKFGVDETDGVIAKIRECFKGKTSEDIPLRTAAFWITQLWDYVLVQKSEKEAEVRK